MTPAIAYLRVSTQEQARANEAGTGFGLDSQRAAIAAWAEQNGRVIVAEHVDAGLSGSNGIESRLGLADALAALEAGEASELVVSALSRFARDLVVQESLILSMAKHGARLRSCDEAEDRVLAGADDPDGGASRKFVRQVLAAVAELEAAMIRLRLMRGRRAKAAAGGFIGGAVGFGLVLVDDRPALDPERAEVLARIAERRAAGATYQGIGAELEADGIAGPAGGRWYGAAVRSAYLRHCSITGATPAGRTLPPGLRRSSRTDQGPPIRA